MFQKGFLGSLFVIIVRRSNRPKGGHMPVNQDKQNNKKGVVASWSAAGFVVGFVSGFLLLDSVVSGVLLGIGLGLAMGGGKAYTGRN
jgi:hypothetical protein